MNEEVAEKRVIANEELDFKPTLERRVFHADYIDRNQNRWWVDVVGVPELADQFAEQRGLTMVAEFLSEEEIRDIFMAQADAGNPEMQGDQAPVDESLLELPSLDVTITLLEPSRPGPYRVKFEVDPQLTPDNRIYRNTFLLRGNDSTANAQLLVHRGDMRLLLEGSQNRIIQANNQGVASAPAEPGSRWTALVQWQTGDPAEFSLRGDISVNR